MIKLTIPIQKLDAELPTPQFAYPGDAGVDLRSTIDAVIDPGCRCLVPTGIAIAIPQGFAGFVIPRSGLAIKHGISVVNAPGLIDSNYRGEIKAILLNTDKDEPFVITRGDRIAQLSIVPVATVAFEEVESLEKTSRGSGGFGSSGI